MASLRELVQSPALAPLLGYVARPRVDPKVSGVTIVDDLGQLEQVSEHSIVLLTRGASAAVSGYRFDMALRIARGRGIAALVLTAADLARLTSTATAIAGRSGTAILGTGNDVELTHLALAIGREISGPADVALLRAYTAMRAIEVHPPSGSIKSMLAHAGTALAAPIELLDTEPTEQLRRAVLVDDRVEGWVATAPQEGDMAMAAEIVLRVASAAVASALMRARTRQELPTQSREEVLTDLLTARPKDRDQVVLRARSLGLPIDAWHVAVRLDFESLSDHTPEAELDLYGARMRLGTEALQSARTAGGIWHQARAGEASLLLHSYIDDPGPAATEEVASTMEAVLAGMRDHQGAFVIRCGVGSPQAGPEGLLGSAVEARAAATAARTSNRTNVAVQFNSVGLRRSLVEWYASDTAREAATAVLQPLTAVGGVRGERLIQTLHVFLDERGSLTRTAQRMSLHRNAVAYRINRVFDLLEVDRENPDDLLLLQLACRARELT